MQKSWSNFLTYKCQILICFLVELLRFTHVLVLLSSASAKDKNINTKYFIFAALKLACGTRLPHEFRLEGCKHAALSNSSNNSSSLGCWFLLFFLSHRENLRCRRGSCMHRLQQVPLHSIFIYISLPPNLIWLIISIALGMGMVVVEMYTYMPIWPIGTVYLITLCYPSST